MTSISPYLINQLEFEHLNLNKKRVDITKFFFWKMEIYLKVDHSTFLKGEKCIKSAEKIFDNCVDLFGILL